VIFSTGLKILRLFVIVCLVFVAVQYATIFYFSQKVPQTTKPFEKIDQAAKLRVLFLGDSTAVGTGTSSNIYSTAGWFSRDYPDASIDNYAKNGLRLKGFIDILSGLQGRHYDLSVMQIGCNDIIYMTRLSDIQKRQRQAVDLAKNISEQVIILHCGDLGKAKLFLWPLTELYSWRSFKVRDIYRASEDSRVKYVDIIELEKSVKNLPSTYAPDNLHLNDEGYHIWYQFIKNKFGH